MSLTPEPDWRNSEKCRRGRDASDTGIFQQYYFNRLISIFTSGMRKSMIRTMAIHLNSPDLGGGNS